MRVARNKIKNELHARRQEKIRLQQVKELLRKRGGGNSFIPPELSQPITDPEKAVTD